MNDTEFATAQATATAAQNTLQTTLRDQATKYNDRVSKGNVAQAAHVLLLAANDAANAARIDARAKQLIVDTETARRATLPKE